MHALGGKRIRRKCAVFLFHPVAFLKLEVHMMQILIHVTVLKIAEIQSKTVGSQSGTQSQKSINFLFFTREPGGGQVLITPEFRSVKTKLEKNQTTTRTATKANQNNLQH